MKIRMIYLASGNSRRFGANKLLYSLKGRPMYRHLLERLRKLCREHEDWELVVVTQYPEIMETLQEEGINVHFCKESIHGVSWSIKAGMEGIEEEEACVFFVADQPFLREETVGNFLETMEQKQAELGCVICQGETGNPVWFGRKYFGELGSLAGDQGGKKVLNRHRKEACFYSVKEARELKDVDFLEDMPGMVANREEKK